MSNVLATNKCRQQQMIG